MTPAELNEKIKGPVYNRAIPAGDHGWCLLWTGWKTSTDQLSLFAQWCAARKDSVDCYVSATPGGPNKFRKGEVFDVSEREAYPWLTFQDFSLPDEKLLEKANEIKDAAYTTLILFMERDGAFEKADEF